MVLTFYAFSGHFLQEPEPEGKSWLIMSLQRTEIPLRTFCDAKQLDNCSAYSTPPPLWALSGICQVRHSRGWAFVPMGLPGVGEFVTVEFHIVYCLCCSVTSWTGALRWRLSNHNVIWKQSFLNFFFANRPIKIDVQPCNCWKL